MALISLRNITLAFGGPPLFDGINLQIEPGDRLCLMGRNGSGKSTLLKLIGGELAFLLAVTAQPTNRSLSGVEGNIPALEAEIDRLYGLADEEIAVVGGNHE